MVDYQPTEKERTDLTAAVPESPTAEYECLACGRHFDDDIGNCPDDGTPLRKIGTAAAGGQADKIRGSTAGITNPASAGEPGKPGSKGNEPPDDPRLQGERPSADRPIGEVSG